MGMCDLEIFTLTADHVKLLRRMLIDSDPCVPFSRIGPGTKRPFGNSDIASDMAEILGIQRIEVDNGVSFLPQHTIPRMAAIWADLSKALQVVLSSGSFEPGEYRPVDWRTWERIE